MAQRLREITPDFQPVMLFLKCEGGSESNPVGPVYYKGAHGETVPLYVDLSIPSTLSKYGYASAWFSLQYVRQLAKKLNLPVETF